MIRSVIAGVGLVILTIVLQLTVLPAFGLHQYLNLFLVLTIMATLTLGVSTTIWWVVTAAVIMDSYSLLPFGIVLTSSVVTVLIVDLVARHWMTNRATLTIGLLVGGATVCFSTLTILGLQTLYWLNVTELTIPLSGRTLSLLGLHLIFNSLLAMMLASAIKTSRLTQTSVGQHM